jgi:hypothetical protein
MLAWASAENKSHIRLLADVGFLLENEKRIPFGNDRQKSKNKYKGKCRSGSFALLRMTTLLLDGACGYSAPNLCM